MQFWGLWPWALEIVKMKLKIGAEIEAFLETAFEAIWTPPRRFLASIWARFWSPGRVMLFSTKIAPRYSESTIFRVQPKWLPAATRLQERLGRLLGSILARFWPPFWRLKWPWRPLENDIKNKSDLKTILGPLPGSGRPGSAVSRSAVKAYPGGFRPGKS